ncbi:hypothetical protein PHYPSEUDO_001699 [Phytophthora pseudosyringae]|uniref:Protein kinase domain-containing protein n=1 Tax=Phytophthora pseudosyringae TaxID=221518 RepID=A0A8T1VZB5_9STRA|nr:hypothetical protein PHYPSEUDO_001699 [Phytophthora pseudosyringae]
MVLSLGHECIEVTDDNIDKASSQWRECDVGRGLIALRNRENDFVLTHHFEQSIRAYHNKIHCANNLWTIEPGQFRATPLPYGQERPEWVIEPKDVVKQAKPLAEGGFGSVYRAEWACTDVVVKEITVHSATKERRVRKEVELWSKLRHANIVPFNGANGTLSDYLGASKDNRKSVWRLLYQVAAGLNYLHSKGVIHGDLKGNNIVVSELGTAMLTDFGLSFLDTGSCSLANRIGTLGAMQWRAPEFARQTMTRPTFTSDIYSFGMCIIAAVNGADCPWGDWYDNSQVRAFLRDGDIRVNKPDGMTADQWNIVRQMIANKPCDRPGLDEVLSDLKRFASEEQFKEMLLKNSTPPPSREGNHQISQNQLEQQEEQKRDNKDSQKSSWWNWWSSESG